MTRTFRSLFLSAAVPLALAGAAPGAAQRLSLPAAPSSPSPSPSIESATGERADANPSVRTAPAPAQPSDPLGAAVFDWRWLAAAAALLASLAAGWRLWRWRRRPKVLRLAAPSSVRADAGEAPAPARIDLSLEITGATRSLMMFTLHYRLILANRSERAVSDLAVGMQLASAQREASNAAPHGAAQGIDRIERLGPHQSRSVTGVLQMPLAAITPVMQGATPLFIPLVHVTIEGAGQQALARSFVVGPPASGGSEGRVRPLTLDLSPGSLPALAARPIAVPPA